MEKWQSVTGYEGLYEVSNRGNVRRIDDGCNLLKPFLASTGYPTITLSKHNKQKNESVHRLVAEAFCVRKNGENFVNHKDCDKTNNAAENLEWCTNAQNIKHAYDNGRCEVQRENMVRVGRANRKLKG